MHLAQRVSKGKSDLGTDVYFVSFWGEDARTKGDGRDSERFSFLFNCPQSLSVTASAFWVATFACVRYAYQQTTRYHRSTIALNSRLTNARKKQGDMPFHPSHARSACQFLRSTRYLLLDMHSCSCRCHGRETHSRVS